MFNNNNMNFPCKNCEKRTLKCHSTCKEYLDAKAEYEAYKAEIKKKKEATAYNYGKLRRY